MIAFIDDHGGVYGVEPICRVLPIAHPPTTPMSPTRRCMRDLVDVHYPQADLIRVVLDNLSTHNAGALDETFPAPEAHRVLQRLEFHYTPKHASWLIWSK